jgi:hypothetical protein
LESPHKLKGAPLSPSKIESGQRNQKDDITKRDDWLDNEILYNDNTPPESSGILKHEIMPNTKLETTQEKLLKNQIF